MVPHLRNSFSVDQTVHGYRDGHRLLKASCDLSTADLKTMLILSDASGTGALIPETGYITGYPLIGAGLYALAKTWTAKESERPGSVWTHTLLINFADLAAMESFEGLAKHFSRPSASDLLDDDFQKKTVSLSDSVKLSAQSLELATLRRLTWALYKFPNQPIITALHGNAEALVLRIWSQQWPRLRRNFRFCTLAHSDRSLPKARFDLQFVPLKEGVVSRFHRAVIAEMLPFSNEEWLETAMNDLCSFERTKFQMFLRSVGSEILQGREAFIPLCEFYPLLSDVTNSSDSVDRAVQNVENEPDVPKTIRSAVANAACGFVTEISNQSFEFLVHHLELVGIDQFKQSSEAIGTRYLRQHMVDTLKAISNGDRLQCAIERAILALSVRELISILSQKWSMAQWLINARPEILLEREFWQISSQTPLEGLSSLINQVNPELVAKAIVDAQRIDLISWCVKEFGAASTLKGIGLRIQEGSVQPHLYRWLDDCLEDSTAIADYLQQAQYGQEDLILSIAHRVDPTFVPCLGEIDPWLKASVSIEKSLSYWNKAYLCCFLLVRCLKGASCEPALMLATSFDTVHAALEHSRIPGDAWDLLSPSVPKRVTLVDWDKCARLRSTIIDQFIDGQLPMNALIKLTENAGLFKEIVKGILDTSAGREAFLTVLPRLSPSQKKLIKHLLRRRR